MSNINALDYSFIHSLDYSFLPSFIHSFHSSFIHSFINAGSFFIVIRHKGKSRGIKDDQKYLKNCVRKNTFQNIANQLNRGDGWKLLVMQLKERMSRRENDDVFKELVPLREFQKYDSTFSTYLKGNRRYKYINHENYIVIW